MMFGISYCPFYYTSFPSCGGPYTILEGVVYSREGRIVCFRHTDSIPSLHGTYVASVNKTKKNVINIPG